MSDLFQRPLLDDGVARDANRWWSSSERKDWCTPDDELALVRQLGRIGLDPCSNPASRVGRSMVPLASSNLYLIGPRGDALTAKRAMASSTGCPASIFTGRTRLYVQAMYGRPLYRYGSESSTSPAEESIPGPSLQAGSYAS